MNRQNRLAHASSPYLKQHANNPVDWYEWGDEALTKAREENKPLLISIGYAACHWCHVMAHESFEDESIAEFMNAHFVCIKIDREERPDIDRIYMEAAQLLSGRGGWPLNAFALPDGRPFYAGTYFPSDQWSDVMSQLSSLYMSDYTRILKAAEGLTDGIRHDTFSETPDSTPLDQTDYQASYENHIGRIDFKLGGYTGAPKFMMPTGLEFLLQYYYHTGDIRALNGVVITLDEMAKGGIYDQIGGGFARYSTDEFWLVPHFEKMLYDNAQLITLYSHAYQITKKPRYAEVVAQTIAFAERELMHPNGGFYASIDADSEHEEGKFYVWTRQELLSVLDPKTADLILDFYQIRTNGNWESGKNILHYKIDKERFAADHKLSISEFNQLLNSVNEILLENRNLRIRPGTDDKILTSWNALMLSGYVNAYKTFGVNSYLDRAVRLAKFLESNMLSDSGTLFRVFKDGRVTIDAFLDDYALLADALLSLYEVTFDIHWLSLSKILTEYVWNHFQDSKHHLFFYTSDQSEQLIARKHETSDNVIPASNSVMAHVLFKLGMLSENNDYSEMAVQMSLNFRGEVIQHGAYYANWAMLIGRLAFPTYEVAVLGDHAAAMAHKMQFNYLPTSIFAGGISENLPLLKQRLVKNCTLIYLCKDKVCNLPVSSAADALDLFNLKG
jgi:uncharacterized protein